MATTAKRAAQKAAKQIARQTQTNRAMDVVTQANLARRSSGAAGAHAKSGVHRTDAAGRKTRVGNRSAQRRAHIRDWS